MLGGEEEVGGRRWAGEGVLYVCLTFGVRRCCRARVGVASPRVMGTFRPLAALPYRPSAWLPFRFVGLKDTSRQTPRSGPGGRG